MKAINLDFGSFEELIKKRLDEWDEEQLSARIWKKDPTVWIKDVKKAESARDLTDRLGWLNLPLEMEDEVNSVLVPFAMQIKSEGFRDVVVLGMGGSSLAPETFQKVFGNSRGFPALTVLDSTNPASVRWLESKLDLQKTLFVVSSKSGGTVETRSFFQYFIDAVSRVTQAPGNNFIAITDAGSTLHKIAEENRFRRVFLTRKDVGGRFSVFTEFGLVPAALIGVDLNRLMHEAKAARRSVGPDIQAKNNLAVTIGVTLGAMAGNGIDKIHFLFSPQLISFGDWLEQLLAESTGKGEKGIIPVIIRNPKTLPADNNDSFCVYLRLNGDSNTETDVAFHALEESGRFSLQLDVLSPYEIGAAFYLWELATAAAGSVLEINPFNQPDVELTKKNTREFVETFQETGSFPIENKVGKKGTLDGFCSLVTDSAGLEGVLKKFLGTVKDGDYVNVMAFLPVTDEVEKALNALSELLVKKLCVPVIWNYGPRFLHSTGQLHKGGSNNGVFVQITHAIEKEIDIAIPGEKFTFGNLITAQAMGDFKALKNTGRRIFRIHINGDIENGLSDIHRLFL